MKPKDTKLSRDEALARLDTTKRELDQLRFLVTNLCSEPMRKYLDGWLRVESFRDLDAWLSWLASKAVEQAWCDREGEEERAPCPICRSTPWGKIGYSLPAGLERHIRGSHRQQHCLIVACAQESALEKVRADERGEWRPRLHGKPRLKPWEVAEQVPEELPVAFPGPTLPNG